MTNGETAEFSSFLAQSSRAPRRLKQCAAGTYTGLIAYAIQESPDKKLTFKQIMTKLEPYVFGEKRSFENNIRVCLSAKKCFVKVPVDPDCPNPKKNFWKVDESCITPKMFQRHFKYIMHMCSDTDVQVQRIHKCEDNSSVHETLVPVCKVTENKSEVKFTGPFSIESLLKSDYEVKRMRSTQMEEHPHYREARCAATKRKHLYAAVECFYPVSAEENHLVSAKRPRLSPGPQFGLTFPQQIKYDHRVLFSSPLMFDKRYVSCEKHQM
ncbi:forkhead box protein Q1-like [Danio aesculapii]|uniref:forkhead box protein Q1-like n=1 Tax=Danio aesculapii TaxID=1142201 RepID=UPI0024C0C4D7|nr:forkhead box protein Q1-like [Danio aesculapii]